MRGFFVAVCIVCAVVVAELALPGRAVYHAGWFNALLLATVAGIGLNVRRLVDTRVKGISLTLAAVGVAIVAAAGIAYGLLAPDDATVVAAPNAQIRVNDLGGVVRFGSDANITLVRGASATVVPTSGRRLAGAFILRSIPRAVVAVDVSDARGGHLTMTQPNGTVFLSSVLTMAHDQAISGVALPFDTFAVPALHRIVHAVLFDPHQAAALLPTFSAGGKSVILFAVDDETDRPIPGAIAVARDGDSVFVAGLRLRPTVTTYPALAYFAVPMPLMVGLGILVVLLGGFWPAIVSARSRALDANRANG
jgi:hypothetical protein